MHEYEFIYHKIFPKCVCQYRKFASDCLFLLIGPNWRACIHRAQKRRLLDKSPLELTPVVSYWCHITPHVINWDNEKIFTKIKMILFCSFYTIVFLFDVHLLLHASLCQTIYFFSVINYQSSNPGMNMILSLLLYNIILI